MLGVGKYSNQDGDPVFPVKQSSGNNKVKDLSKTGPTKAGDVASKIIDNKENVQVVTKILVADNVVDINKAINKQLTALEKLQVNQKTPFTSKSVIDGSKLAADIRECESVFDAAVLIANRLNSKELQKFKGGQLYNALRDLLDQYDGLAKLEAQQVKMRG